MDCCGVFIVGNKSYTIEKITDLLKIPPDRMHDCMNEIADQFIQLQATLIAQGINPSDVKFDQEVMTWVDDGMRQSKATIKIGDKVLTIQTNKGDQDA